MMLDEYLNDYPTIQFLPCHGDGKFYSAEGFDEENDDDSKCEKALVDLMKSPGITKLIM